MINHLTTLLSEALLRYPGCWEKIDSLQNAPSRSSHEWPAHCFLPLAKVVDIVMGQTSLSDRELLEKSSDIAKLGALSAWRATQRVYKFDTALLSKLRETPVSDVPFEIFHQLPDWCVYIGLPGNSVTGCFVHMETTDRTHEELRFLFDFSGGGFESLYPMVIHPFEGTVKDCLQNELAEAMRELHPLNTKDAELNEFFKQDSKVLGEILELLPQTLSQALYLCSINADYSRPAAEQKRTKQRKFDMPNEPEEIEVCLPVGARLNDPVTKGTNGSQSHALEHPQWHHYWAERAPSTKKQDLVLKWESGLLDTLEQSLPATTRKS